MAADFRTTTFCEQSMGFKTTIYGSCRFIIETYIFSDRELYIQLSPVGNNQSLEKYKLEGKIRCASSGEVYELYAYDRNFTSNIFLEVILNPNLLFCFHLPSIYEIPGVLNFYANFDNLKDSLKCSTVILTPNVTVFGYDISYIEMNRNYIDVVYRCMPEKQFRVDCNLQDITQSKEKTSKLFRSLNYTVIKDLCSATSSISHLQFRLFREFEYTLNNIVNEDTNE